MTYMVVFLGERHKTMDEPSQDKKVEMLGRAAESMHLEVNEKFGKACLHDNQLFARNHGLGYLPRV